MSSYAKLIFRNNHILLNFKNEAQYDKNNCLFSNLTLSKNYDVNQFNTSFVLIVHFNLSSGFAQATSFTTFEKNSFFIFFAKSKTQNAKKQKLKLNLKKYSTYVRNILSRSPNILFVGIVKTFRFEVKLKKVF